MKTRVNSAPKVKIWTVLKVFQNYQMQNPIPVSIQIQNNHNKKAYCEPCWLFANRASKKIQNVWIEGYDDWKHIVDAIERHETSKIHLDSCLTYRQWRLHGTLDEEQESMIKKKIFLAPTSKALQSKATDLSNALKRLKICLEELERYRHEFVNLKMEANSVAEKWSITPEFSKTRQRKVKRHFDELCEDERLQDPEGFLTMLFLHRKASKWKMNMKSPIRIERRPMPSSGTYMYRLYNVTGLTDRAPSKEFATGPRRYSYATATKLFIGSAKCPSSLSRITLTPCIRLNKHEASRRARARAAPEGRPGGSDASAGCRRSAHSSAVSRPDN
ncbi:hypothetical protein EVAR_80795_1 [Eumeta japonica]|uniref:Uncharacterized protein n=1 Tax=Eumeta variegata TaxID=151549 RepID=A0A4C1WG79_EUMVA|nr:hypothetical protein EVAR_80795_1 [Eumeta japonica]